MRIIAGSARGRRLAAPRGAATRPTAAKVRQAIFNILQARGPAPARVLDLYAGTGAMGLEALSRGATQAVFVESHAPTATLIRKNADALGFAGAARVETARVLDWLSRAGAERFGWIFVDPPYDSPELSRVLAGCAPLLDGEALLVVEHDAKTEPDAGGLSELDRRRYGQSAVTMYVAREA